MGVLAAIIGLLIEMIALVTPSGAATANLDTMNLKTNLVVIGAALFLGGIISNAAARVERAIRSSGED